jgi:hypothetical protein
MGEAIATKNDPKNQNAIQPQLSLLFSGMANFNPRVKTA